MKKAALIFVLAVFLPALILGALAVRTASSQGVLLERQEADLRQQETDALAALVRAAIATEQQHFSDAVNRLLAEHSAEKLAAEFHQVLREQWRREAVGFAVTMQGQVLSPAAAAHEPQAQRFLMENIAFLGSRTMAEVYQAPADFLDQLAPPKAAEAAAKAFAAATSPPNRQSETARSRRGEARSDRDAMTAGASASGTRPLQAGRMETAEASRLEEKIGGTPAEAQPQRGDDSRRAYRRVAPQKQVAQPETQPASRLNVETSSFQNIIATREEGILARFVQDRLEILFWIRPASAPGFVYGARLVPDDLRAVLDPLVEGTDGAAMALLDEHARAYALSHDGFSADWKRPFVASEIGEVLPHWEAALYLLEPDRLQRSARLLNLSLWALTALALGAILTGGFMVVSETRRQMALVQKKTDFVSSVSHELKTPLTSIRMFAEMLHEERVTEPEKRRKYLRVITLEADRLSRLINNVLDFARLERSRKQYNRRVFDLHAMLEKIWEAQEMHLQGEGYIASWRDQPGPYPVFGDSDALAQVVVNLISNAEKYSPARKEIEMHSHRADDRIIVSILDRGLGIPVGEEEKIFESFYRAHDSLDSGIAGSGLGLTLARRIARDHGGDVTCAARAGGGSIFTLTLKAHEEAHPAG